MVELKFWKKKLPLCEKKEEKKRKKKCLNFGMDALISGLVQNNIGSRNLLFKEAKIQ